MSGILLAKYKMNRASVDCIIVFLTACVTMWMCINVLCIDTTYILFLRFPPGLPDIVLHVRLLLWGYKFFTNSQQILYIKTWHKIVTQSMFVPFLSILIILQYMYIIREYVHVHVMYTDLYRWAVSVYNMYVFVILNTNTQV